MSARIARRRSNRRGAKQPAREGYVFLISVLVVGTIASAVVVSLVLLGLGVLQSVYVLEHSAGAFSLAHACAERGLDELRRDEAYAGGDTVAYDQGECEILFTGGYGNENRTLCAEATVSSAVRRLEIVIAQLQPSTKISSWQEVDLFSLCDYP